MFWHWWNSGLRGGGEHNPWGTYEVILRLVLKPFQGGFLPDNELHSRAAQLPRTVDKGLDIVKSYYPISGEARSCECTVTGQRSW